LVEKQKDSNYEQITVVNW